MYIPVPVNWPYFLLQAFVTLVCAAAIGYLLGILLRALADVSLAVARAAAVAGGISVVLLLVLKIWPYAVGQPDPSGPVSQSEAGAGAQPVAHRSNGEVRFTYLVRLPDVGPAWSQFAPPGRSRTFVPIRPPFAYQKCAPDEFPVAYYDGRSAERRCETAPADGGSWSKQMSLSEGATALLEVEFDVPYSARLSIVEGGSERAGGKCEWQNGVYRCGCYWSVKRTD